MVRFFDENKTSYPFNADWMRKLSDKQKREPITRLIIPGSHDSGAYKLYTELGIAIDRPGLNTFLINQFSFFTFPIISRYSQTQNQNVFEQLKSGVRYLDLRIGLNPLDGEFYITHNFYGPSLLIILFQIKYFIENYPSEAIIIDIQHVYNVDSDCKFNRLVDIFRTIFSDQMFLHSKTGETTRMPSLNEMINNRRPIMIIYRGVYHSNDELPEFFWPKATIYSPWPDTRCPSLLEKFIDKLISTTTIDPDRLFVMQTVLTPNNRFVVRNFWSSLRRLSEPIGKIIMNLFKFDDYEKMNNINIVMYDYIDRRTNDKFLINEIIAANFNKSIVMTKKDD
ncbi:Variant-surface-glycoprotein phospholipase C-like protein [Euroglyphus maynei]|uniref:Variant-surface-glycoprotein phospholipase C-like protein n=1 Tax=Euroglyphus maynei TaxID=6958 RepID=A0A1Y3BSG9_EURMA|nr:Variant-surface-glycoprotein phospholipase C-like protein [Euroglyphus maynei]